MQNMLLLRLTEICLNIKNHIHKINNQKTWQIFFQIEFREWHYKQLFVNWRLDTARHPLCPIPSQTIFQGTAWIPVLKGKPAPAQESCCCWFHQFGFEGLFTLLQSCPWAYEKATLLVNCIFVWDEVLKSL